MQTYHCRKWDSITKKYFLPNQELHCNIKSHKIHIRTVIKPLPLLLNCNMPVFPPRFSYKKQNLSNSDLCAIFPSDIAATTWFVVWLHLFEGNIYSFEYPANKLLPNIRLGVVLHRHDAGIYTHVYTSQYGAMIGDVCKVLAQSYMFCARTVQRWGISYNLMGPIFRIHWIDEITDGKPGYDWHCFGAASYTACVLPATIQGWCFQPYICQVASYLCKLWNFRR